MKKPFTFKLGNRGLLPEERAVVEVVNQALRESAQKHGRTLNASANFVVKARFSATAEVNGQVAHDSDGQVIQVAVAGG